MNSLFFSRHTATLATAFGQDASALQAVIEKVKGLL